MASLRDLDEPVDLARAGGAGAAPSRRWSRTAWRAACGRSSASRSDSPRPGRRAARSRSASPARVREAGAVLLGPNCMGVWSGHECVRRGLARQRPGAGAARARLPVGRPRRRLRVVRHRDGPRACRTSSRSATRPTSPSAMSSRTSPATRVVRAIGVYCEDFRDGRGFLRAVAAGPGGRQAGDRAVADGRAGRAGRAVAHRLAGLDPARRGGRPRRRRRAAGGDAGGADGGRAGPADADAGRSGRAGRRPVRRRRHRGDRDRRAGGRRVRAARSCPTGLQARLRELRPNAASTSQPDRPDGGVRRP